MSQVTTRVTITCLGDCGSQSVYIRPAMVSPRATDYCAMLDGSSAMYVADPRKHPESTIGKCANCKGPIKAEWVNFDGD